ncbi:MAG: hypothetical protein MJZ90_02490 [Bacteroidales bacterium]|nr:hypothetical protein [Bacteroidales bacterium]
MVLIIPPGSREGPGFFVVLIDITNINVETFENVGPRSDTTGMAETKINPDNEMACCLTFYSEERELVSDSVFNIF